MSPRIWFQDCGIARRCKLFLGTDLERGAPVLEAPFVWPPMERRREFAAAGLQTQSYLEREHNARWAALRVAHATSGIYGQCIDITFAPQHSRARPAQSLYLLLRGRWASGSRHVVGLATDARCMAFSRPLFCAFDDRTLTTSRPIVGRICTDKRACIDWSGQLPGGRQPGNYPETGFESLSS
jgi:hypothetical protein